MSLDATALPRLRTQSLNDVRAVIPEACYRRSTGRATWALLQAAALYLLPVAGLALTDTVVGAARAVAAGRAGCLGPVRARPRCVARRAGGVPPRRNRHHRPGVHGARASTSRPPGISATTASTTATRPGRASTSSGTRPPSTSTAAIGRFARLRHRFEWSCVGSGAYFLRVVWWQKMWRFNAPGKRHDAIVRDKLTLERRAAPGVGGVAALGALTSGWIGALWVPFKLFVVPFLRLRAGHRVDGVRPPRGARHPLVDRGRSGRSSTARWRDHHRADTPWSTGCGSTTSSSTCRTTSTPASRSTSCPRPRPRSPPQYPTRCARSRCLVAPVRRATRACKLYDFEAGRWLPYSAAQALTAQGRVRPEPGTGRAAGRSRRRGARPRAARAGPDRRGCGWRTDPRPGRAVSADRIRPSRPPPI